MKNVITEAGATNATLTPEAARVTGLQTLLLELVLGSAFATQDEKDRTVASVARCQNPATLAKWYRNAVIELADREEHQPVCYATGKQKEEITRLLNHVKIERREKTKVLLVINRLEEQEADEVIKGLLAKIEQREGGAKAAPGPRFFSTRDWALYEQETRFYSMQERNERMAYADLLNR